MKKIRKWVPGYYKKVGEKRVYVRGYYTTIKKNIPKKKKALASAIRKKTYKPTKEFKLTEKDLHNLYDFLCIADDTKGVRETLKLNKLFEWYVNFFFRLEKIVIPELYEDKKRNKIIGVKRIKEIMSTIRADPELKKDIKEFTKQK